MRSSRLLAVALATVLLAPAAAVAAPKNVVSQPTCTLPESNADSLELLSTYYQGYWWDHADLTIAVQSHPRATEAQLDSVHDAIQIWSDVLLECFDGAITLTDVTGTGRNNQQVADMVVHFVPHFGGAAFGGIALCGRQDCGNIIVGSVPPPGSEFEEYTSQELTWVALHEIGHALGLGHATNLEESTDLMGYGWPDLGDPVLSDCDIDALAVVFAWVLEGGAPHRPEAGPYDCSLD